MSWKHYVLLALLGLGLACGIAQFQHFPGYLDADYYYAGGVQIAAGKGFTEPYLWNYLDDPGALPHPSHAYWMPLSSLIAAAGVWIGRTEAYESGRWGFLLLAALVPVVTAALAYDFTRRADLALVSGLLAVFPVYYAPFLPVPDNYGPYIVLGALYFLLLGRRKKYSYFLLGVVAGLMTLARSDGLLWLGITAIVLGLRYWQERQFAPAIGNALLAAGGILLIVAPWFWHTYSIYGTLLAPGGGHLLWLKSYDETFLYPANQLTFQAWASQGWAAILAARWIALRWNMLNAIAAQGELFLLPFILVGLWISRQDGRARIAVFAWACLLLVMTMVFPYAGPRGGFFHAGAAVQSMWWVLAPVGLDRVIVAARKRRLFTPQAFKIFQGALVGMALLLTAVILSIRVLPGWGEGEQEYPRVEAFLKQNGIQAGDVVMVRNPPGYYLMTGRSAIVVPYGDEAAMSAAAGRYGARYLIIESAGAAGPIKSVYDGKDGAGVTFLGDLDGTHIYKFIP